MMNIEILNWMLPSSDDVHDDYFSHIMLAMKILTFGYILHWINTINY